VAQAFLHLPTEALPLALPQRRAKGCQPHQGTALSCHGHGHGTEECVDLVEKNGENGNLLGKNLKIAIFV